MKLFLLLSTFFSLIIGVFCPPYVENTFAFIAILGIGILHGANDLLLIKKAQIFKTRKPYHNLFYYIILIGLTALLFYQVPQLALPVFVLFSAYHFGEQHWGNRITGKMLADGFFFSFYGLLIFFLLFYMHQREVQAIIYQITSYNLSKAFFSYSLYFSIAGTLIFGGIYTYSKRLKTLWLEELLYVFIFALLFKVATLLWAFATYFVIWHAIPSLKDQLLYLYGDFNKKSVFNYLKSALVYWWVSIVGLGLFIYFFKEKEEVLLALFFSFLAAITFPHVLVIMGMHRKSQTGEEA